MEFVGFPKVPRWNRDIVITEKIDGTNAQVFVGEDETGTFVRAGSRNRWITPDDDNFGFAAWVHDHEAMLADQLGPGRHYGEWWGSGIQRGYGLPKGERRLSLFNPSRYFGADVVGRVPPQLAEGLYVVPTLYVGPNLPGVPGQVLDQLARIGSFAAVGFDRPEGIVVYHTAARQAFKVTVEGDEQPKTAA